VIGGGAAGLAAALRLSVNGCAVTLLEHASALGGRLLTSQPVESQSRGLDALPPVLFNWQSATIDLLTLLGTNGQLTRPVPLRFTLPSGRRARLRRTWGPAPLNAVVNLLVFGGLPFRDRWRLLLWLERTWEGDPPLPRDLETRTADHWLAQTGQSAVARAEIWDALARWLLGDALTEVSAAMFVQTLARCLLTSRREAAIRIPDRGWDDLLIRPAGEALRRAGGVIRCGAAAVRLRFNAHRVTGVQLATGDLREADWYVLAVPHRAVMPLLPDTVLTHFAYFQQLTQLQDTGALTVHLLTDLPLSRPRLVLFSSRPFHWMVARPSQPGSPIGSVLSLVMTGAADSLRWSEADLRQLAEDDARVALPALCSRRISSVRVVKQAAAFLSLRPGVAGLRPLQQSPFSNLFLAGDWTDTGLPANLESAILSGARCAELIERAGRQPHA